MCYGKADPSVNLETYRTNFEWLEPRCQQMCISWYGKQL